MTETRMTSSTGGQKGVKAQRYDLLPRDGLDRVAEVYAFGAEKYADHNWRRGYPFSQSYAALMRHMTAFWDGEDTDPESGLSHVAHAGFHVLSLLTWLSRPDEYAQHDDRWSATLERESVEELAENISQSPDGLEGLLAGLFRVANGADALDEEPPLDDAAVRLLFGQPSAPACFSIPASFSVGGDGETEDRR